MQRLDQRQDEQITVGELVTLDNLKGIDNLEGIFGEEAEKWWRDYKRMMLKYNPPEKIGKVISHKTHKELSVRVRWANGQCNSYYPHNLREV